MILFLHLPPYCNCHISLEIRLMWSQKPRPTSTLLGCDVIDGRPLSLSAKKLSTSVCKNVYENAFEDYRLFKDATTYQGLFELALQQLLHLGSILTIFYVQLLRAQRS